MSFASRPTVEWPLHRFCQGTPVSTARIKFTLARLLVGNSFLKVRSPSNLVNGQQPVGRGSSKAENGPSAGWVLTIWQPNVWSWGEKVAKTGPLRSICSERFLSQHAASGLKNLRLSTCSSSTCDSHRALASRPYCPIRLGFLAHLSGRDAG